jgi:hypothetical protein
MLHSPRVRASEGILEVSSSEPIPESYEASHRCRAAEAPETRSQSAAPVADSGPQVDEAVAAKADESCPSGPGSQPTKREKFLTRLFPLTWPNTRTEIAAEQDKPFQPVGGIVELLGSRLFSRVGK